MIVPDTSVMLEVLLHTLVVHAMEEQLFDSDEKPG